MGAWKQTDQDKDEEATPLTGGEEEVDTTGETTEVVDTAVLTEDREAETTQETTSRDRPRNCMDTFSGSMKATLGLSSIQRT